MKISFSEGDIIANQREIVIRLSNKSRTTLQAEVDAITLIGGANVINAVGSGAKWSVKLDDEAQLQQLAEEIGIAVEYY
ncbi:DUF3389 domain-containing protein [Aliivibrio fischeri]|uniref:DUF3389 family protein n=1 Tax=Aliivibrio fischeri TaxID=668 RepID=A0A510UM10_ALIFS|nr:DUF3389 domain-containing protein [Aliivibrio fischeri]MBP3139370.1 DUF3389 domain-containing protein [Aliivibrio fischeri]MBP3154962.1 DUF3389 domain-containing protein [Aliivibrio fischeri]MCE7535805.1 DUF3389 domain-containing protein [Aliivibrio fischeri]MCE7555535.1 DUF3389 domain-containing protein [Aliivibrio fischeri]MCE7558467.1 DUF3389 domain-containing protein [Aliivibrio fischeri]